MTKTVVKVALAVASAAALAGCGGSSGGLVRPDVTLSGAELFAPDGQPISGFEVREIRGGSGAGSFLITSDDSELLAPVFSSTANGSVLVYRLNSNNTLTLRTVDGLGDDDTAYDSMRYYTLLYTDGGTQYGAEGVIGPATDLSLIASSTGTATYGGAGTASLSVLPTIGSFYQKLDGDTFVEVNFGTQRVLVLLNNFTGTGDVTAVQLNNLILDGNRFASGGGSSATVTGATFSPGTLDASGALYGWNGTTLKPDEVGGVLQLTSGPGGVIVGRFAAD